MRKLAYQLVLALVLAMPGVAGAAWQVTASASPSTQWTALVPVAAAGNTTSGSITTVNSALYVDYTINVPGGYTLTSVTIDGAAATPDPFSGRYRVNKGTTSAHTIRALFAVASSYNISTTPSSGGYLTPSFKATSGTNATVEVIPNSGYNLASVTIDGITHTSGAVYDSVKANRKYTFISVTAPHTVAATYRSDPKVTAYIKTPSQTQKVGMGIVVDGSGSSANVPATYTWSVSPALGATLTPAANGLTATLNASATGAYTVTLKLSGAGAADSYSTGSFTYVTPTEYDSLACTGCHTQRDPALVSKYQQSQHWRSLVASVSCNACHNPAGTITHPFYPEDAIPICSTCHTAFPSTAPHTEYIGTDLCVMCHDPHSGAPSVAPAAHYQNISSGFYPATYVTSRSMCADCHSGAIGNRQLRQIWAVSGHADNADTPWSGNDYKTLNGCVRCHTTTGFIAYSTGKVTAAWGVASDRTKELLTCKGCHSEVATGKIRSVSPVKPYEGVNYTFPDEKKSNICMGCHAGTNSGATIKAALASGANFGNQPFVESHNLAAAGTLTRAAGYQFGGRAYGSYSSHRRIGLTDGKGPCVSCHKGQVDGHTFIASPAVSVCANCHLGLNDATIAASRSDYQNALQVLGAMLTYKGFTPSVNTPSFSNTNWGAGEAGANTMGAAFNYVLLSREPGAYAHDPNYTKQLILDSIDWLDNNAIDDSVTTIGVPTLLSQGRITSDQASSLGAYASRSSCISCHGGTVASGSPITSNGHGSHLVGAYGPAGYLGTDLGSCQGCHTVTESVHMNRFVNVLNAPGSACAKCHPGTLPAWNSATRLSCTGCHAATPSTLGNGVAAPYKASFTSGGHGRFAASNQCTSCHDSGSRHITGSLGDDTRLLTANDNNQCASCHNDPAKTTTGLNMVTHFMVKGGSPDMLCRACHDPHGTGNLAMIRGVINGVAISYTNRTNGWVNMVTHDGLCQVCHTSTNHYRRGVAETSHPTTDCFNCHSHKSGGGAFYPSGSCDSCHGYPPAPEGFVTFGTEGNWIGAKAEDYVGGGGAHLVGAHVSPAASPSQGWSNCTMCHNGGSNGSTPYHRMTMPVAANISSVTVRVDLKYRFDNSFTIYTGAKLVDPPALNATGGCFNIACHMSPSPRWSVDR